MANKNTVKQFSAKLSKTLNAWHTDKFTGTFQKEITNLAIMEQILQQGLSHTSYAKADNLEIIILNKQEKPKFIEIKTGIFYYGVIAGCSCNDDPTPVDEITEYCEIKFKINKLNAEAEIALLET